MTTPTRLEVAQRLNRATSRVSEEKLAPLASSFGLGFVASFDGTMAAIRKRTREADPIAGFRVWPGLQVEVGDYVLYYELGADKLVFFVLDRNAILPDELTLHDLTLTGKLLRASVLTPPTATANIDNYAPDGGQSAYWWRLDANGAYDLTGILAEPDAEHGLINVSAFNRTLKHNVTSAPANRILSATNADLVLPPNGIAAIWYDAISARWRAK